MVDDVVNLVWCKLMEDRHGYGTISKHGKERCRPRSTVTAAERNLITLLHARTLKHDVQLFYLSCHIMILQRSTLVIGERITLPILDNAVLD